MYSYGQNHEITVGSRLGIANTQFQKRELDNPDVLKYAQPEGIYDAGIGAEYKYAIWKRASLFLSTGIYYSKSQYTFPIYSPFFPGVPLEQVILDKNRIDIQFLGLAKQFTLFEDKLILELGANLTYRLYNSRHDQYLQDTYLSTLYVNGTTIKKYKYDINVFYGKFYPNPNYDEKRYMNINSAFNITSKYMLLKNCYLNIGFFYQKNFYFFYDYLHLIQLNEGEDLLAGSSLSQVGPDSKLGVKNDFLNFTIGLSYKFGK